MTTLADLDHHLRSLNGLSATRRRDLRSAVTRVAALLNERAEQIPLDLTVIASKVKAINPVAAGLTPKRLSNIRSDFLAAVRVSGLLATAATAMSSLTPPWTALMAALPGKRARIGLSRLARYAGAAGLTPSQINDAAMAAFIADVREGSLHQNPNALHQKTATIWNEVVSALPHLALRAVTRPSFRGPPKRIDWATLTEGFQADVGHYLEWCSGADVFDTNARPRALAPRTLRLRRDQIHAAVTALIESGVNPASIKSLADLVSTDAFKRILRRRHDACGGRDNSFNRDLAESLVQIAREWVKVGADGLADLNRLTSKVPMPISGLTTKNKRMLRQFDDPAMLQRLRDLPARLWSEVKRHHAPNFRTLAKAQAALAIAILSYIPLRIQNLKELTFDVHLFLRDGHRATSSLEIPEHEVKNKTELAFDIPPHIARMLIEYRDNIAPKVIGRRPERLFVNADGTPKSQAMVALLIKNYLRKRAGIEFTAHLFRHLSAKVVLDAEPGSFEIVRQLLGHKSLKTTVASYAGIDSRRAGRHHQRLIDAALTEQPLASRRRRKKFQRLGKSKCKNIQRNNFRMTIGRKRTGGAGKPPSKKGIS
jgi:integrase